MDPERDNRNCLSDHPPQFHTFLSLARAGKQKQHGALYVPNMVPDMVPNTLPDVAPNMN